MDKGSKSNTLKRQFSKGKKELVSIMAKKSAVIKEVIEASSNSADSSSSE
jgi:hypothetical protein